MEAEAMRDMAKACQMRAQERDDAEGRLLTGYAIDHERRSEIARMLGMSTDRGCEVPKWDALMTRLNECLTTFRYKPRS